MLKRKLVIVLAVLAAAASAGGAYAATRGSSTNANARQAFLNDAAKRLHVTPAQLQSALTGAFHDQLNAAVKAGKLTQAQANAIEQRMKNGGPFLGRLFAPHPHPYRGALGPRELRGGGGPIAAVAKYLGLTRRQLFDQLRSGKSLAQVAQAKGKTTAGLENAITTAVTAELDKAVADKRITAAQEKKILSRLSSRLDALVNRKGGKAHGGAGWGAPGPGGPPGAPGGPPPGAPWGRPGGHPGSYVPVPRAGSPFA